MMTDFERTMAEALVALLPPDAAISVRGIPDAPSWERAALASAVGLRCATEATVRAGASHGPRASAAGPIWPKGFVGSISHARHVAIAVAAPSRSCASLGIDVEPTMSFARAERVMDVIACKREREACGASPWRLTLLFSAKESIFKCLHPLVGTWFDFQDAEIVRWDDRERRLWISLLCDLGAFPRGTEMCVRYAHVSQHILTGATAPNR